MYLHLNNECQCYRIEERVESANRRTEVVNLNPVYRQVYSIQHYAIKFVSDLRQVSGFFRVLWFPPTIKLTATI